MVKLIYNMKRVNLYLMYILGLLVLHLWKIKFDLVDFDYQCYVLLLTSYEFYCIFLLDATLTGG